MLISPHRFLSIYDARIRGVEGAMNFPAPEASITVPRE
jgi:hypothetical protein